MRVLRVITTMNPEKGGPSQGIRNSIPALRLLGIENEVVTFDQSNEGYLGNDDFPVHAIGPSKSPYEYCDKLEPWLIANFSRFDSVIIHGLWLYNSYGTYKSWKKFKKINSHFPNLYIMPHGMLDPYFQRAKERKLKAIRNIVVWNLIEKHVVNGVNGMLFTCEQELKLARESFSGYAPKAELNVKYGILPPPSYNASLKESFNDLCGIPETKTYWLFLSRIHQKKGVDLLISAYLKLKQDK